MALKQIPFDLETAKKIQAGEIKGRIKTERGENTRIICWDRKNEHHTPIVALVDCTQKEELYFYSEAGEYDFGSFPMLNLVLEVPDNKPQFKPFDKVLVRDNEKQAWLPRLFDSHVEQADFWTQDGKSWKMCIPYEGNEYLVGTTYKPKEE